MRVYQFSEQAYYPTWNDHSGSLRVILPNRKCDPHIAADLFHRYYDEYQLCDELGLDIMLNEHHQTATCMSSAVVIGLAVLARITKKARLLVLGYPIGHRPDPLRVAEELSTIDVISRGRLDMGFIKGIPYEIPASNRNPTELMDRFWEAHDFIIKAMTTHDGTFNWEGEFFHYRQVNIWPRVWQEPHPPVWSTTGSSTQARVLGERGYVMATLGTGYGTRKLYDAYRKGYVGKIRHGARRRPLRLSRPGRGRQRQGGSAQARRSDRRLSAHQRHRASAVPQSAGLCVGRRTMRGCCAAKSPPRGFTKDGRAINIHAASVDDLIDAGILFCGTPDEVYDQIVDVLRALRRHGQSPDDGPGRLPHPRADRRQSHAVLARGVAAAQGL